LRTSSATTAKPHSRFAGFRSFHRRVQRQDAGLESDLVNHFDDFGDLPALSVDLAHGRYRLLQGLAGVNKPMLRLRNQICR
jgi:hypothetical protein